MSSEPPPQPIVIASAPPRRRRLWLIAAVVIVVLLGGAAFVLFRSSGSDRDRAEALQAAQSGNFAQAEPRLKAALERTPTDAEVAEALARGYLKEESAAEAEAALTKWIELRPDDREPLRLRFEHYRKSKDLAKAYPDGRRLLELEPSNVQLPRVLMVQAFSLGRFDEAEPYCRTALRELPGDKTLRSMLAEIRRARGDNAEAGQILDLLLKDYPTHTPALLARGVLHLDAGEPEKAAPLLREVVRTDPTRARNAGYKLAVALERCGEIDEAKRVTAEVKRLQAVANAEDAIKIQPDNLALQTLQGEMLLTAGHSKDGLRLLERVLARDPVFPPAHRVLATYYERIGEPDKAAEHRRRAGA